MLQHILDIYDTDSPNYVHIIKHLELFGDNLSYKNLNGDQMLTVFFKKFFTNKKIFKRLINYYQNTESSSVFENQVKDLLSSDESKSKKRQE